MEDYIVLDENLSKIKIEESGKITVISVASESVEECHKQLKILENVYNKYLDIIALYVVFNIKEENEIKSIKELFSKNNFSFNAYFDLNKAIFRHFNIIAVPTTIILDKTLNTVDKIVGLSKIEEIEERLDKYIDLD